MLRTRYNGQIILLYKLKSGSWATQRDMFPHPTIHAAMAAAMRKIDTPR